jgi:thiol-disulfide isomerase/thioredoxin
MKRMTMMMAATVSMAWLAVGCQTATPKAVVTAGSQPSVASPIDGIVLGQPKDVGFDLGKKEKRLWAKSYLWSPAPVIQVEKWLNGRDPDLNGKNKGKFILLCIWDSWCPWCRKFNEDMVKLHDKYQGEMVVIGISDEPESVVGAKFWADSRDLKAGIPPSIPATTFNYYVGIDTQARLKKEMGVTGVPHVVIIEPEEGCVVWEGYPYDTGYELTMEKVDKILAVKRAAK